MLDKKPDAVLPVVSLSQTGGLTSIEQLVDTTANEIFSFNETTSNVEEFHYVVPSFREPEVRLREEEERTAETANT